MFGMLGDGSVVSRCQFSRRVMLHVGGLAPLGIGLPELLANGGNAKHFPRSFGKAKRCLMLFMWGGPSHIDLFDMKPGAPSEIRGPFNPLRNVPNDALISELIPGLASVSDKIGFIRSVSHTDNNHSTSAHWMLTGHKHPLSRENFGARPSDFPHIGSVVSKLSPGRPG